MRGAKARAALSLALVLAAAVAGAETAGGAGGERSATPSPHARPTGKPPARFFGIVPQTHLTDLDAEYMRAGGIGSVRWPLAWSGVRPSAESDHGWGGFDEVVAAAARQRLTVLPFAYATPAWLSRKWTRLPVDTAEQRRAWAAFLRAAVKRYGPRGEFWREHGPRSDEPLPKVPIREWQVWNECNFFYFATPASPIRYARLLKISSRAIKSADRGATVILSGLFGEPTARPPHALPAIDFLRRLYRVPGIKASFDGIALHPYAEDARALAEMTEGMRRVALENRDPRVRLYLTELGWGSQHDPDLVSFERGVRFQLRELRRAYRYLIENRRRLNLKGTYWFTWKDIEGSCNFCDSTGFFRRGERLRAKPAWHAFVRLTGGRARP